MKLISVKFLQDVGMVIVMDRMENRRLADVGSEIISVDDDYDKSYRGQRMNN